MPPALLKSLRELGVVVAGAGAGAGAGEGAGAGAGAEGHHPGGYPVFDPRAHHALQQSREIHRHLCLHIALTLDLNARVAAVLQKTAAGLTSAALREARSLCAELASDRFSAEAVARVTSAENDKYTTGSSSGSSGSSSSSSSSSSSTPAQEVDIIVLPDAALRRRLEAVVAKGEGDRVVAPEAPKVVSKKAKEEPKTKTVYKEETSGSSTSGSDDEGSEDEEEYVSRTGKGKGKRPAEKDVQPPLKRTKPDAARSTAKSASKADKDREKSEREKEREKERERDRERDKEREAAFRAAKGRKDKEKPAGPALPLCCGALAGIPCPNEVCERGAAFCSHVCARASCADVLRGGYRLGQGQG